MLTYESKKCGSCRELAVRRQEMVGEEMAWKRKMITIKHPGLLLLKCDNCEEIWLSGTDGKKIDDHIKAWEIKDNDKEN